MQPFELIGTYCNSNGNLQTCLQGFYNMGLALAIALAFLMAIFGAFQYLLGAAINVKEAGKKRIIGSIYGLAIIFTSGVLLYWINPSIFSAELITFRVSELTPPKFEISQAEQQAILAGEAGGGNVIQVPNRGGPGTLGIKACDTSVLTTITAFGGKTVTIHRGVAASLQRVSKAWEARGGENFYHISGLGGYNCRSIKTPEGQNTGKYSSHAYGLAVDINCLQNPFRRNVCITNMPADFRQIFNNEGWGWGGDWRTSKDPMHMSKAPNEKGDGKLEQ